MKPAEDGMRLQCAKTLNWTTDRRIFVKGSVGASSVIVVRIGEEHPAQMRLATGAVHTNKSRRMPVVGR